MPLVRKRRVFKRYNTDESNQFIFSHGKKRFFLRVPRVQTKKAVFSDFFYKSMFNILYPTFSMRMRGVDFDSSSGSPKLGVYSDIIHGRSSAYKKFQHDYYTNAHARSEKDPKRVAFFQRYSSYTHPLFVTQFGKPLAKQIYKESGLALDTKGPMNVVDAFGIPVFVEVFTTAKTDRLLAQKLKQAKVTEKQVIAYWKDVPMEVREWLLAKFRLLMR